MPKQKNFDIAKLEQVAARIMIPFYCVMVVVCLRTPPCPLQLILYFVILPLVILTAIAFGWALAGILQNLAERSRGLAPRWNHDETSRLARPLRTYNMDTLEPVTAKPTIESTARRAEGE